MNKRMLISLVVFLTVNIIPQVKNDSVVVNDYINKIDSINNLAQKILQSPGYTSKRDPVKVIISKMNLKELKHIDALLYKATDLKYIESW